MSKGLWLFIDGHFQMKTRETSASFEPFELALPVRHTMVVLGRNWLIFDV